MNNLVYYLLIPYQIFRWIIVKVGTWAYLWLGIKPSQFLFLLLIIDAGRLAYKYYSMGETLLDDASLGIHIIQLTIECLMFILKRSLESKETYSGTVKFRPDVDNTNWLKLLLSFLVCLQIRNPISFISLILYGFYFLDVHGDGGRLWNILASKLTKERSKYATVPS